MPLYAWPGIFHAIVWIFAYAPGFIMGYKMHNYAVWCEIIDPLIEFRWHIVDAIWVGFPKYV
jgi:hypothetical protein